VSIVELAALFHISPRTIHKYRRLNVIPPPSRRGGRNARYDTRHVEGIRAWRDLQHLASRPREVIAFCQEEGITLPEYNERRRQSIADFGIGVA
jgi:DNA-binding transcriptional MerR regulator